MFNIIVKNQIVYWNVPVFVCFSQLRSPQQARSKPSGTVPVLDKPHSGNNQTWNQSLAMIQVPYRPPPVPTHNHHQWSPYPPTGNPYGPTTPPIHNHTWIQNNYSYHYPPSYPVQLPATSTAVVPQRVGFKLLSHCYLLSLVIT